jgi:hypothetical protein
VVIITLFFALIVMGLDAVGPDLVFGGVTAIYMVAGKKHPTLARTSLVCTHMGHQLRASVRAQ